MNAGQYITAMQARVPLRVPSTFDWYTLLNHAGTAFYNAHEWSFAGESLATVSAVSGRDYLKLPDDFVSLTDAESDALGRYSVRASTTREVIQARGAADDTGAGYSWLVAFDGGWTQNTPADYPEQRAPIYPTPTGNGRPTLTISYRRGWADIPADMTGARPNIPRECRHAFELLCKSLAWEHFFAEQPSPDRPQFTAELARLIAADNLRTGQVQIRGGVQRRRGHEYVVGEFTGD